jgi:20S proteasome alpha/beta subunit
MTELRTVIPDEIDHYLDALVRTGPFSNKAELVRAALVSFGATLGPMAQGFDKENIFSPDGRIYQIEYARESSRRGAPIAGAVYDRGVVLGARYMRSHWPAGAPITNTPKPLGKIVRIGNHVALAGVGLVADFAQLVRELRRAKLTRPEDVVDRAQEFFWEHTIRRDLRPLGTSALVAAIGDEGPTLFHLDASGSLSPVVASTFGMGVPSGEADSPTERLISAYRPGKAKEAEGLVRHLLGAGKDLEVLRLEV